MAESKRLDNKPNATSTQRSSASDGWYLGIIMAFIYLACFGELFFERTKQRCSRYDELGGVVRHLDCAQSIVAYSAGAVLAFIVGLVIHRVLLR